jgi:oligopeptide/dipeptide ABC transporter ATP-binding protein
MRVGKQIAEAVMLHQQKGKREAWQMAADLLARVGIPDADKRVNQYPFEFSGGMRQRAMIAMAISCNPDVLIADEPTTALDVTIQAQIIDVVREMQDQFDSGVILITHDLGVIAEISDKVMVMYGGRTVEYGSVDEIFYNAHHPYTWGLLASLPRLDESEKARLTPIKGQPPNLITLPGGCPFTARCPYRREECRDRWPAHESVAPDHGVYCWIPAEERIGIRADLPHFKESVA